MLGELLERSPRQVGPYRILARLGAGGMGEVFLGADTRPTTSGAASLAAVKVVRAELLGSGGHAFRDRFRREISTARAVEGRFTARLLTGDADAPAPWLATEYVAGPTLDRAVRETGPLPAETVRSLGLGLVRALRGIHHARVLHRDLKPANVLLGADGPRVIDFGIARDFGASTLTATGAMVGSPGYMSPEHVLGGRHVVSASDVFSLASVLCYAATGEGPFGTGPVAAVLYRVSQAEARLDAVPAELRALIEDCLRPDPSARPDAIELEARFRDAGARDPAVWPDGVRAQVALYEGELARTVEAAGPVAGRVPTMPGASPLHSARTVTGPPREPLPRRPDPRRRRVTILAVVAGALTLGVLGAFGIRALQDDSAPKSPNPEAGSDDAGPRAALVGLDKHGVDRSRYFPVDPAARPDGWQPWAAKLSGRPWDCVLNSEILVCRMFYGGLEAVGVADGKPRWKAPSAEPDEKPGLGASSGMFIPGDATNPVIHGDSVLSTEGGTVRSRSLEDGTVRWKRPLKAEGTVRLDNVGEAMVGDGVAFFTTRGEGTEVHAFDADTGKPLWKRALSTYVGAEAVYGRFGPSAFAGGRLLASTDGGLTGFDARTGKPTPFTVPGKDGGNCVSVRVMGGEVLCGIGGKGSLALDAETLRPVGPPEPGGWLTRPTEDLVPVGMSVYVLAPDEKGTRMELFDAYEDDPVPRTVGDFPPAPKDGRYLRSEASVVGPTAVFLDNEFLYTLPVEGDDPRGTRSRIEGAPGNRAGSGLGDDIDGQVWEPELISVGGVLFLMFHDGTVRSMELPA